VLSAEFDNGNKLPGVPQHSVYGEVAWKPYGPWQVAIEVISNGKIYVSDSNEDAAAASTIVNLRVGARFRLGMIEIEPLLRLDNATDRKYVGSVIVNEANKRFFESAPSRAWIASVTARYRF
jgi:iron complex outermembrane receptor protein